MKFFMTIFAVSLATLSFAQQADKPLDFLMVKSPEQYNAVAEQSTNIL